MLGAGSHLCTYRLLQWTHCLFIFSRGTNDKSYFPHTRPVCCLADLEGMRRETTPVHPLKASINQFTVSDISEVFLCMQMKPMPLT